MVTMRKQGDIIVNSARHDILMKMLKKEGVRSRKGRGFCEGDLMLTPKGETMSTCLITKEEFLIKNDKEFFRVARMKLPIKNEKITKKDRAFARAWERGEVW